MANDSSGYFEFGHRILRLKQAGCEWSPGLLSIEASGPNAWLKWVAIPFPNVTTLQALPGQVWNPDDDTSIHFYIFMHDGFEVRGRPFDVQDFRL